MSSNIRWFDHKVSHAQRVELKQQKPCILWFTGLSGAGKSTLANTVDYELYRRGQHTYVLDGDNVRHGLNKDLGFTDEDRIENIRRIGEASKLFLDAGLIVLSAFISPFREDRNMVRKLVEDGDFIEVFVSTPLSVCEDRDPKGLYKKARKGEIKHFTGIDSPYQEPENPEIVVDTSLYSIEEAGGIVIEYLEANGYIPKI
ncbi:adenylyl-sulfate kinase [Sessilibacter corallicola]|uniref:adenylyl-sulfate kinase n=1 Tax=Sessilibacter corallicola TaxID=2904075 RepID=UPI001E501F30|nr:adenylyl-sulfate kinase [Sessilibacter corallicola]MCE2029367.1 adenylyl-sulfate kinase [Sessilibacter corallicola]